MLSQAVKRGKEGLTERWKAIGLACLGEGRVHSGLGHRREDHLAGVRRHCWTGRETMYLSDNLAKHLTNTGYTRVLKMHHLQATGKKATFDQLSEIF